MTTRFLHIATFLLAALAFSCSTPPVDRPNILFIMVDDLGPEWISAYGSESIETPNIDRLANEGMLFEKAYSMPQCTPTRVTLLTGQYPYRHGWTNHWDVPRWGAGAHFDPDLNLSFARLLRENGYKTAAAGKWQINDFRIQPEAMVEHGFDEYAMWTGYESLNPPSAERYQDAYIHTREGSSTYEDQFGPDVYTDFLIEFMKSNQEHPMLLYFPMALTHTPLIPTPHEPDAESRQDRHKAMTRYMDHLVGRLTNTLDELNLREKTYIFFTTDNGTTRGIEGQLNGRTVKGGKGSLGENGMRAPFIVSAPGRIPSGSSTDILMDFSDLFPTFLELANIPISDSLTLDGISFASTLHDANKGGNREWVLSMGFGPARLTEEGVKPVIPFTDRAVRDHRFKLWVVNEQPSALYDLELDPGETENLFNSEEPLHQEAREKLEAIIYSLPPKDAAPRYNPMPPQPWDKTPATSPG
ncbi:MAG: sulfatase-like hydrolase/transferase [Rhodothermaceae bacterium]|nr:sulfatase-like hydrolase/transferase [Rhodothermaceae bacterium]